MPRFNYYGDDNKLITEQRETLNEANLERFIEQHGAEKAVIYLEALSDFCQDMRTR